MRILLCYVENSKALGLRITESKDLQNVVFAEEAILTTRLRIIEGRWSDLLRPAAKLQQRDTSDNLSFPQQPKPFAMHLGRQTLHGRAITAAEKAANHLCFYRTDQRPRRSSIIGSPHERPPLEEHLRD